eukprot:7384178-Prymnesium_polylepis.1
MELPAPPSGVLWHPVQFREQRSSSASFGFRVEGATARGIGYPNCKDIQSSTQISNALHFFVQSRAALKAAFLQRLEEMRATLRTASPTGSCGTRCAR